MRFLSISALIARMHLPHLVRSKRAIFCVGLAFLPALAAALVAALARRANGLEIATNMGWILLVQISVPLVALVAASAVVAEEIEDRTITYLFTRPVPRATLLVGRLASTLVFLMALFAVATAVLLYAASRAPHGDSIGAGIVIPLFQAVLAGVVVYSAVFAMLGALSKHPMIVGLAYSFVIEGFLANLPGSNQKFTITYYLRNLVADGRDPAWGKVEAFEFATFGPANDAWWTLACVFVAALLLGAQRITRRQFELTS